ncbi:COMM domain-containing protein 3-like [Corticium candelabrum]|uniref:COMM domain-containing protein 3-like n=1 Tax=Corticium candelabrum TaxID=121492 RepID=UPI002E274DE8|nr:COMM domain-containing protein 3-like [Corticium candelabrum]
MDLSPFVVSALQAAGDESLISHDSFTALLELCLSVVINKGCDMNIDVCDIDSSKFGSCDIALLKQCYSALMTLIVEAVRVDASASSLTNILEDCKMASVRIGTFNQLFLKQKHEVRAVLGSTRNTAPHVVDVNWRLDYCMKDNQLERVNKPVYVINLMTEELGSQKQEKVQFACTTEQLQDFVGKLKDASRSLEKASVL